VKSMEVKVPRNLVDQVYPHPELHGDFVVSLKNGMITDVFYDENGCYYTITSETDLIAYLNSQEHIPPAYFFRNGVFSFRNITKEDDKLLERWDKIRTISVSLKVDKASCYQRNIERLPSKFLFQFYWMEVGLMRTVMFEDYIELILDVYYDDFVRGIDRELALDSIRRMLQDENSLDFK